jgi:uncharacterized protein
MPKQNIEVPKDEIVQFCRRHHLRRLALFGSVLRDDFGPQSDVDVLVEFEPGHTPSFFRLFEMQDELSAVFGGRKVDIRTEADLSRYFREEVVSSAWVQYAA